MPRTRLGGSNRTSRPRPSTAARLPARMLWDPNTTLRMGHDNKCIGLRVFPDGTLNCFQSISKAKAEAKIAALQALGRTDIHDVGPDDLRPIVIGSVCFSHRGQVDEVVESYMKIIANVRGEGDEYGEEDGGYEVNNDEDSASSDSDDQDENIGPRAPVPGYTRRASPTLMPPTPNSRDLPSPPVERDNADSDPNTYVVPTPSLSTAPRPYEVRRRILNSSDTSRVLRRPSSTASHRNTNPPESHRRASARRPFSPHRIHRPPSVPARASIGRITKPSRQPKREPVLSLEAVRRKIQAVQADVARLQEMGRILSENLNKTLQQNCARHDGISQRDVWQGDGCAVCLDELDEGGGEGGKLVWCKAECGQNFHAECLRKWLRVKDTCPLCGKKWLHLACACGEEDLEYAT